MDFDKSGNYLGVGDHGGRIILFKKTIAKKPDVRRKFLIGFQMYLLECRIVYFACRCCCRCCHGQSGFYSLNSYICFSMLPATPPAANTVITTAILFYRRKVER